MASVKKGDVLYQGSIFAEVPETRAIVHKAHGSPGIEGTVLDAAADGKYTIHDPLITLLQPDRLEIKLTMAQKWPIRIPRPVSKRYRHPGRSLQDSVSWMPCFPLAKRRHRLYPPAASAQVKP